MFLLWRCDSKPQKLPKTSTEHDKQTKMLTELPQTPLQSIRCRNKHPTFIPTEVPLCCPKGPKGATTKHGSWHHSAPPARSETFNVRGGSLHNVEVVVFNVAAELCKVGHLSFCKNVSVLWQWPLDGTVHHYIEIRGRWKNPVWENPAAAGSVLPLLCDNIYIYFLKKMTFLSSQRYSSFWYVAADACLLLLCCQEGAHFRKTRMTQSATLPLCFPHTDSHAHLHRNDEDCERVCCATAARSFIFLCSVIADSLLCINYI